jgi:hypothetical protein
VAKFSLGTIMKRTWNYNILHTSRIQSILLGLVIVAGTAVFLYQFTENIESRTSSTFLPILVIYLVLLLVFSFSPIHQVLEIINESEFSTYYRVSWLKLNVKVYSLSGRNAVRIKQDVKKYYCLTIMTQNAGEIIIERYPTLDSVKLREDELKEILN